MSRASSRSTLLRRSLAAIATVAVASIALSGCLYTAIRASDPIVDTGDQGQQGSQGREPSTVGVPAGLESFYGQRPEWGPCDDADDASFDCTTIAVPLDYNDPEARSIEIAVLRHSAGENAQGSLLVNPGGPGSSGRTFVRDGLNLAFGDELPEAYDLIGFDPRGVELSAPVRCYEPDDMDSYLFDPYTAERGSDAWQDEAEARAQGFAEACEANSDGVLPYITTEFSARDMDVLRAVLGDDELSYLGFSYGTKLGATYAQLFPERVGRMVLDGAMDPTVTENEVGLIQAGGFESALRAYMQSCLDSGDCPFTGTLDDAMQQLQDLMADVDDAPIDNGDGRVLDGAALNMGISSALYSEENWPYLTMALDGVIDGDPTVAYLLVDIYYDREGPGSYGSNSQEAFAAYNCMDYLPSELSDAEEDAQEAELERIAPTISAYWGGADACEYWPSRATKAPELTTAEGAAPIVVVGTTNDPATPYEWSEGLADVLDSGVLVTREGEGHTGFNKGNACVDDAVNGYLISGTVPQDGLVCDAV